MKALSTSLILAIVVFAASCIPTLNPLYTEADLIMDPALVGTWVDKESGEMWTFSNTEKFKYSVIHLDSDGRKSQYDGRLVKLENKLFLDIVPIKSGSIQNEFHQGLFFATHTFVHVVSTESTVQISYMDARWLKDFLAANPEAIRHEKINGEILLTSSPKETQKFVLAHLTTREAFSAPTELSRKRGGS
jgi:hypothetical protein